MNIFCSMALVLSMDVSASMTATSWKMQQDGLASAFEDHRIQEIILNQPNGIAVAIVHWASTAVVAHPWVHLQNRASIRQLADDIRKQDRSYQVGSETGLGIGLNLSVMMMSDVPCDAHRRVIDISGDGRSNHGIPPSIVRDHAQQHEITINGLPITNDLEPDVANYYRENVITSDGFVEVAEGFEDFGRAIRRKLATEIAQVGEKNAID